MAIWFSFVSSNRIRFYVETRALSFYTAWTRSRPLARLSRIAPEAEASGAVISSRASTNETEENRPFGTAGLIPHQGSFFRHASRVAASQGRCFICSSREAIQICNESVLLASATRCIVGVVRWRGRRRKPFCLLIETNCLTRRRQPSVDHRDAAGSSGWTGLFTDYLYCLPR